MRCEKCGLEFDRDVVATKARRNGRNAPSSTKYYQRPIKLDKAENGDTKEVRKAHHIGNEQWFDAYFKVIYGKTYRYTS